MEKSAPFDTTLSVKTMEEQGKKHPAGTTSDVAAKNDSDPPVPTQDSVPLSPFAAAVGGKSKLEETQSAALDSFYGKLRKLCESSGVPIIEDTKMDLFKLYNEVIERGGFQKVLKDGKWNEVTSSFNLGNTTESMEASQLQKIYSNILYSYEQIYHYRSGKKDSTNYYSIGEKRKYPDVYCLPPVDDKETPVVKKKSSPKTNPKTTEEKLQRDKDAPMSPRTAYQMYLKIECIRLKKVHSDGEDKTSGNQNFRDIAIETWRHLSKPDREPYVEESKKDRERFNEEMAAYMESKKKRKTENMTTERKTKIMTSEKNASSSLQENEVGFVPNEPVVKIGSVPNEPIVKLGSVPNESIVKLGPVSNEPFVKLRVVSNEPVVKLGVVSNEQVVKPGVVPNEPVVKLGSMPNESVVKPGVVSNEPVVKPEVVSNEPVVKPRAVSNEPVVNPGVVSNEQVVNSGGVPNEHVVKLGFVPNESVVKLGSVANEPVVMKLGPVPNEPVVMKLGPVPNEPVVMKLGSAPNEPVVIKLGSMPNEPAVMNLGSVPNKPVVKIGSVPNESGERFVSNEPVAAPTVDYESIKIAEPSSSLFHVSWNDGHGSLDLT